MHKLSVRYPIVFAFCLLTSVGNCSEPAMTVQREMLSLDGTWDIIFDHDNEGMEAGWHLDNSFSKQAAIRQIQVPMCWELIEKDYEGVAFYRRTFKVAATWEGKVVRLHFGAVNYLTEVWLNDEVVGSG